MGRPGWRPASSGPVHEVTVLQPHQEQSGRAGERRRGGGFRHRGSLQGRFRLHDAFRRSCRPGIRFRKRRRAHEPAERRNAHLVEHHQHCAGLSVLPKRTRKPGSVTSPRQCSAGRTRQRRQNSSSSRRARLRPSRTQVPLFDAIGQRNFVLSDDPKAANLVKHSGNFLIASVIESLAKRWRSSARAGSTGSNISSFSPRRCSTRRFTKPTAGLIASEKFSSGGLRRAARPEGHPPQASPPPRNCVCRCRSRASYAIAFSRCSRKTEARNSTGRRSADSRRRTRGLNQR